MKLLALVILVLIVVVFLIFLLRKVHFRPYLHIAKWQWGENHIRSLCWGYGSHDKEITPGVCEVCGRRTKKEKTVHYFNDPSKRHIGIK